MKILHVLALLLTVFCVFLCVGLSIGACFAHSHEKKFLASAVHADATVIANISKSDADSNDAVFFPQFTFQTPDGQSHTITSNSGSYPASYSVGQHVDVLYTPGNPDAAQISGFMNTGFLTLMLGIFSGATLLAAVFWVIIDRAVIVPKLREQKT